MNDRYVDLRFNKTVMTINPSDLLVKANVAMKQILSEKPTEPVAPAPGGMSDSTQGGNTFTPLATPGATNTPPAKPAAPNNTRFFMSAKLDNTRVNRDMNNYLQEIIQHLQAVEGSDVELTLEVSVTAPKGIPSSTVRTVSENCRTLKITNFGFDD